MSGETIPVIAITGGMTIAIFGMLCGFIRRIVTTRARERTRREVAAYVAEGSMTAEEGERLLKAGLEQEGKCGC
jgi:hypothetical protein